MSHFVVFVIGEDVDAQLEPYWELDLSFEEAKDDPRSVFEDNTEEVEEGWKSKIIERVLGPGEENHSPYDYDIRKKAFPNHDPFNMPHRVTAEDLPEGYRLESFKAEQLYESKKAYAKDYHGYNEFDGRFGYFVNPNAKWDWFSIGGRWSNWLKIKPGAKSVLGEPGVFGRQSKAPGFSDQARICDIDFEYHRNEAKKSAEKYFDNIESVLSGYPDTKTWEECRELHSDIEAARAFYHNQAAIPLLKQFDRNFLAGCSVQDYKMGRDAYVAKMISNAGMPYAVVCDGEWYGQGEMGWFGISLGDKDTHTWHEEVMAILNAQDPTTLLTVVDCHI